MKHFTRWLAVACAAIGLATHAAPNTENQDAALGINVTGINYWSTQWMLVDVMKQTSNGSGTLWVTRNTRTGSWSVDQAHLLDLDEQGWPRSLPSANDPNFHFVTTIIYQDNQHYQSGDYVVLYDGQGELEYTGVDVVSTQPGRDVVRLSPNRFFHISIRQTDPLSNGDYLRNIRVIRPGGICGTDSRAFAETAADCDEGVAYTSFEHIYEQQTFHPLFLQDMDKYRSIRFMQFFSTNVSEQEVWSDRPKHDYASWSSRKGSPYEVAIEMANEVQAEPWMNVPARVDDDYMRQYARLVRDTLDRNLDVHVELGNEVWNSSYPYIFDALWMEEQAKARWPDAGVSDFEYRLNYFGLRTAQMCEIWKEEFGDQADRVKCVMGAQGGNYWVGEQSLECRLFANEPNGFSCARDMDSLAIGPYFGGYLHEDKYQPILNQWLEQNDNGLSNLFTEMNSGLLRELTYDPNEPDWAQAPVNGSLADAKRQMVQNKAVADRFGVKLTAYEGGQHLTFAGNLQGQRAQVNEDIFLAGNRDPRMGEAFTQHFNDWKDTGGSVYMVFESTAIWGSFGAFPLKEYQTQPMSQTPKLAATIAFNTENQCWWDGCERVTNAPAPIVLDDVPSQPQEPQPEEPQPEEPQPEEPQPQDPQPEEPQPEEPQPEEPEVPEPVVDTQGPTQPQQLTVTYDGEYGFELSWQASTDESGVHHYYIYRDGDIIAHTFDVYFHDQWAPQGNVEYQVMAVDTLDNESELSSVAVGSIPSGDITLIATPVPESWGVALSWDYSGDDVQYFKIFKDGQFIGHTNGDTTSFNADWLQLHIDYSFEVKGVNPRGDVVVQSNVVVSKAGDSERPSQPQNFTVTFDGAYGFTLNWVASSDNTGVAYYKIFRNGEHFTHTQGTEFHDEWPPQDGANYFIVAYDNYHNASEASEVVVGSKE